MPVPPLRTQLHQKPEKESGTFGSLYRQPLPILDFALPGN